MGALGDPSDVGAAALFFATNSSEYVIGIVLPVDGGNSPLGFDVSTTCWIAKTQDKVIPCYQPPF